MHNIVPTRNEHLIEHKSDRKAVWKSSGLETQFSKNTTEEPARGMESRIYVFAKIHLIPPVKALPHSHVVNKKEK